MMIFTAHISRRRIVLSVALAVLAAAVLVCCLKENRVRSGNASLKNNPDRISYLRSIGWRVESRPKKTILLLLPEKLGKAYADYNTLQKKQGFDLEQYCGKQITRYTYAVTNYPGHIDHVQLNLYVCGDRPVAGDVVCIGENGFRAGLAYPGKISRT